MPNQLVDKPLVVYIFGDQTYDIGDTLRSLTHTHCDPFLLQFLSSSCGLLQTEVSRLPAHQKQQCPPFTNLGDLVEPYQRGTLNPALVPALTCIAQLGLFLRQVSSGSQEYPTDRNSVVIGICTGTLAAAAALHAIAIAVRLGALAWDAADRVSHARVDNTSTNVFLPWSWATKGSDPDTLSKALEQYALETGLPLLAAPYIAATTGPSQATISGPPDIVSTFLRSPIGNSVVRTSVPMRITAPYHSATLHSELDISRVLSGSPLVLNSTRVRLPIISASSECQQSDRALTFNDALEQASRDCLTRRVALDILPRRIAEYVTVARAKHLRHRALVNKAEDGHIMAVEIRPVAFNGAERMSLLVARAVDSGLAANRSPCGRCSVTVDDHWQLSAAQPSSPHKGLHSTIADSPIAILSASGRFPGRADTMDGFWDILGNGVDTHEMVPPERWSASSHVGATCTKNVSGTGFGCWLHQAGQFDASFFNMSPREAAQADPAQRMALLAAAEALEQAGIVPNRTPSTQKSRVGVWFGCTSNDWMETNSAQNIDAYFIPGGNRAFIPGRINYHFKFSGPSFSIDTACSSSLAALHMACNALWRGDVDTAIVGGTNVITNPDMTAGLDRGHFLSRTGNCKTLDDSADGYCRGEAVVAIVLKRLDDALADKDPVQACIPARGVATNHNAEAESITRPHAGAQKELFEHILRETGIGPSEISYVEMHGTGTQAGDYGETTSVVTTLSPMNPSGVCLRPESQPLFLGAVKANVGHGEAAAGVTSLAKALLMLKHSAIPPHIGVKTKLNHRLPDLQAHNTRIAMEITQWHKPEHGIRRILLNNFSAAGGNTAVILEDPAQSLAVQDALDPRHSHVFAVSAKTSESLLANLCSLVAWIDGTASSWSDENLLAKLSYTTTARRMHHRYRVAITATDLGQLRSSLQTHIDRRTTGGEKSSPVPAKAPGHVFCFTGQGSPSSVMGSDLYTHFATFRADVQRYDQLCLKMGFPSILPHFEMTDKNMTASLPLMQSNTQPVVLQLSHVCFQMALFRLWKSFGVEPTAVVGHSLGEYAALYAAGALSQVDVIHLVGCRALLMVKHLEIGTYTMLVVKAGEERVVSLLAGHDEVSYEICCRNGKENTVLGGKAAYIVAAKAVLQSSGVMCHTLDLPLGFHTSQVNPILEPWRKITMACTIRPFSIPVISPTNGSVLHSPSDFQEDYFVKHCRYSVNMLQALTVANAEGIFGARTIGIEIGPVPVVTRMVKDVVGPAMQTFASVNRALGTWELLAEALAGIHTSGAAVNWDRYHSDFDMCHQVLQLPAYGWTLKEYWLPYINDWSLRKGDPPLVIAPSMELAFSEIYNVGKNTLSAAWANGEVVIDLDLNHIAVHDMAQGHKVYGVPLCTPSVYADIAMMIGNYVKELFGMGVDETITEIADMHIEAALVANDVGTHQILRTTAKLDKDTRSLSCAFSSVDSSGEVTQQHATCSVRFSGLQATMSQLVEAASIARQRIHSLSDRAREPDSNTFRFSAGMIYKMVRQLADFAPAYRGLQAITLDNDALEAAGTISFRDVPDDEAGRSSWFFNPAYLDAFSQLGGFVMNANEGVDLDKELFVNHGWGSMRLFKQLDANVTYHSYVKMIEGNDNIWSGDIMIFDQDYQLFGVIGGVALQGVQKRLMEYIVKSTSRKISVAVPKSAPPEPNCTSANQRPVSRAINKSYAKPVTQRQPQPEPFCPPEDKIEKNSEQHGSNPWQKVIEILSEESGVERQDLADEVTLADIGIDSLLSLVICGRLHDEIDLDLDLPNGALFQECLTVADIRKRMPGFQYDNPTTGASSLPLSDESSETRMLSSEDSDTDSINSALELIPSRASSPSAYVSAETPITPMYDYKTAFSPKVKVLEFVSDTDGGDDIKPAWSLYLQGSRKRSSSTLFLLPDGCGACTSYKDLPPIAPSVAVVGFNCPFMKTPHLMYEQDSLPRVLQSYLAGVRARQPHGPYHLGGWSAGGILAYALAAQLLAAGETVASLTLIDSPPPDRGLDHLPERFFTHCSRVGLFGSEMGRNAHTDAEVIPVTEVTAATNGKTVPDWLLPHFRATIDMLHDYHAPPISIRNSTVQKMNVSIIWAAECAFDGVRYPKLPPRDGKNVEIEEGVKFLSEPRVDFGPGRWAGLFPPGVTVTTHVIESEHHFSMMRGAGAEKVVHYIRKAIGVML